MLGPAEPIRDRRDSGMSSAATYKTSVLKQTRISAQGKCHSNNMDDNTTHEHGINLRTSLGEFLFFQPPLPFDR
jgi:hypothetical protein